MQETQEGAAARSQHVLHVLARDVQEAVRLLRAPLERARDAAGPRTIVLLPSEDELLAVNRALLEVLPDLPVPLPLFAGLRTERLCALGPRAIAGTPTRVLALLGKGSLDLANVSDVAVLWLDELLECPERDALEAVLAEVPRDAARLAVTSRLTSQVEEFLERAFWRARRLVHDRPIEVAGEPLRYVCVAPEQRAEVLRQILDIFDGQRTVLVVFSEREFAGASRDLAALGYPAGTGAPEVRLGLPEAPVDVVVLFELPASADVFRDALSLGRRVVALVPPSRLAWLRAMTPSLRPLALPAALERGRAALATLREELRGVLRSGRYAPYLLALEQLFDEFDPAEVAAAALQWSRESGAADSSVAVPEREKAVGALAGERVRIFLGVGERDGVRPADIVGAIAGECGIGGNRIGRIDLRPSHSVVEVDAEVAPLVLERMSGAAIRGRRVMPRLDRQPAGRREG